MADANFPNFEKVAMEMAQFKASQARGQLQAKTTRVGVRATWKKVGNGWQPTSHRFQRVRANYVASGALVNSIKAYYNSPSDFGITMLWYAEAIRRGRQPMGGMKGGKGLPVDVMDKWADVKGIKAKDPQTGQFIPNTDKNRKAMKYLMNRKIKHFGIQGWDFLEIPIAIIKEKYTPKLEQALALDIDELVMQRYNNSKKKK
jgi:hypothetical protein